MPIERYECARIYLPNSEATLKLEHFFEKDLDDPTAFDTCLMDNEGNEVIIPIQALDEVIQVLQKFRSRYSDEEMRFLRNDSTESPVV